MRAMNKLPVLRASALAFSLATLCFYGVWAYLIPTPDLLWQLRYPPTRRHFATFVGCILLLTLLLLQGYLLIRKSKSAGLKKWGDSGFVILSSLVLIRPLRDLIPFLPAPVAAYSHKVVFLLAGLLCLSSAVIGLKPALALRKPILIGLINVLLLLSPLGLLISAKALSYVWSNPGCINDLDEFARSTPAAPSPQRVILLVFDELAYHRVFVDRPVDVILPELDRLAKQSFNASQVYSPNTSTQLSFFSLFTGHYVLRKQVQPDSQVVAEFADQPGTWVALNEQPSIFSDLLKLGYASAHVGWGASYGRVFGKDLAAFYFNATPPPITCLPQDQKLTQIPALALHMFYDMLNTFPGVLKFNLIGYQTFEKNAHMQCVQTTVGFGKIWITNLNYSFVVIHIPVPHQPYIYDRKQDRFSLEADPTTGYFDNLVLSDTVLGRLRRFMETQGLWDKSTVILTSDHSWRRSQEYDGHKDRRSPLLIKLPFQQQTSGYQEALNTLALHDLIPELVQGKIETPEQLKQWFDANRLRFEHDGNFFNYEGSHEFEGHI